MRKVILFDIDYTLFDTYKFRRAIYQTIIEYFKNKNIKDLDKILGEVYVYSRVKWKIFIPAKFTEDLNTRLGSNISPDFIEKKIVALKLFDNNYYEEVEQVLKELKEIENITIGIFSSGEEEFQKNKIKKIMKHLHKDHLNIFMFKHEKLEDALSRYKNYQLFIVDDFLDILHQINAHNKNVITIWIKRKEKSEFNKVIEINKFKPNYEINNLKELIPIIKNN